MRSSPSTEQDRSKEDVRKREPEQELEVPEPYFTCTIHALAELNPHNYRRTTLSSDAVFAFTLRCW